MSDTPRVGRVLVVDDEPGMLRAAERVLAGYDLRGAARPSEALALVPGFRPDLVVCDVRMPEMDGFALADALREKCPGLDVIFMTGSHTEPDANLIRAVRSKAFYFVQKPFDRQVLLTLVERCLELRRLRDAAREHTARLERELADARVFQQAMLAPASATVGAFAVEARWRPSQELGGDMYDYARAGDGLAFIIADVSGHGAAAALLTAVVKSAFRADPAFEPAGIVRRLAGNVRLFGDGRFVTCLCGRVARGRLEYVNAGHPAAALCGGDSAVLLPATSAMVCTEFDDDEWCAVTTPWPAGARLTACTDGLTDALGLPMAKAGEALARAASEHDAAWAVADALVAAAHTRLAGRPAEDDITVLAIGPA